MREKIAGFAALAFSAAGAGTPARAQSSPNSVFAGAGYAQQWNRFPAKGAKIAIGYDRAFGEAGTVSLGGRGGLLVGEPSPFFGARALVWVGSSGGRPRVKLGGGADLWINTGSDIDSPVFLYVGAESGFRLPITGGWFADVPIEIGVLPFFSPKMFAFHLGAQLGRTF